MLKDFLFGILLGFSLFFLYLVMTSEPNTFGSDANARNYPVKRIMVPAMCMTHDHFNTYTKEHNWKMIMEGENKKGSQGLIYRDDKNDLIVAQNIVDSKMICILTAMSNVKSVDRPVGENFFITPDDEKI